jgi:transcriptional regulator with XRE-family HTH domain
LNQVGTILKAARKAKGMTQEDAAGLIDVTQKAYSNYENGRDISLDDLLKLKEGLEIQLEDIIKALFPSVERVVLKGKARPDVKIETVLTAEQADAVILSLNVLGSVFSPGVLKEKRADLEEIPLSGSKKFRQSAKKVDKQKDIS